MEKMEEVACEEEATCEDSTKKYRMVEKVESGYRRFGVTLSHFSFLSPKLLILVITVYLKA